MIDNFLKDIFLFRRHYTELIFKYSQLPLLSIGSNALLIRQGRKRQHFFVLCVEVWELLTQTSEEYVTPHIEGMGSNSWSDLSLSTKPHPSNGCL